VLSASALGDAAQVAQVAQGVAALLGLVGILLVWWQLRLQRAAESRAADAQVKTAEAAEAGAYAQMMALMLQVDQFFTDRPHLRRYAYGPAPLPAEGDDREQALAACELLVDLFETFTQEEGQLSTSGAQSWRRYVREVHAGSPCLRAFWDEHHGWYCPELHALLGTPEPRPGPVPARAP
jgi:hypothetical protein